MSDVHFARISTGAERTPTSGDTVFESAQFHLEAKTSGSVTVTDRETVIVAVSGVVYGERGEQRVRTPAERIADAFVAGGLVAAAALEGHFAVLLVDKTNDVAHAFGDNRGGRRVFYAGDANGAVVSTKLTSTAAALTTHPGPDTEVRDFHLVYGYAPFDHTAYEGVRRLPATSTMSLSSLAITVEDRPTPQIPERNAREDKQGAKAELATRLVEATESIVQGHDRVGVFLGGFDSALVASLAKRAGKEVVAFTFSYADAGFNQKNVDSVVNALGIEHHWVPITSKTIGDGLSNFAERFDRPTNWPNYVIQTAALAEVAREKGVSVLLTGDGCDEIFLGYPGIYRGSKFFGGDKVSSNFESNLAHALFTHPFLEKKLGHVYRLIHRIIRNRALPPRTRLYLMFRLMDESTVSHLFGQPRKAIEEHVQDIISEVEHVIPDVSPTVLAYEGRDHIVPNRLKISGVMDTSGLPVYTPYMHPDVRDYVRALPEELLRPDGEAKRTTIGKDILLQMADEQGFLPHEVIYQPKHAAVDGPLDRWYAEDLRMVIKDLIRGVAPVTDEKALDALLDEKWIEKFYRKNFSVDSITSHAASLLATYGSFHRDATR